MRTLREIIDQFPSSHSTGLTQNDVIISLQRYGSNRLTPLPREPLWKKFLAKFDESIIKILLAAVLIKTVVDLSDSSFLAGGLSFLIVAGVLGFLHLSGKSSWLPSVAFILGMLLVGVSVLLGHPSFEGLAVMMAIILATGVSFYSEFKSDREFEVLNSRKESIGIKVIRDGQLQEIPLEEVVVGDLIELEMGDEIPADGHLIAAKEMQIDQSLMTGESEAVKKTPGSRDETVQGFEQPGCLYRGTQVVEGTGRMVATEVGDLTMLGQIARRLAPDSEQNEENNLENNLEKSEERHKDQLSSDHTPSPLSVNGSTSDKESAESSSKEKRIQAKLTISKELTPLQLKLTNLAGLISKVGYGAALAIFAVLLTRGLWLHEIRFSPTFAIDPETRLPLFDKNHNHLYIQEGLVAESTGQALRESISNLLSYFVYMVIIIVVAVPEGLPMSVMVSLAIAMRKMTRANSLVRQLVACETIGSATVICSDKTGTLTQNQMKIELLCWGGKIIANNESVSPPDLSKQRPIDWFALQGIANSTAHLEWKEGKIHVIGSSTEGAILQWLEGHKIDYRSERQRIQQIDQLHFTSDRKRMTSLIEVNGKKFVLVKGAPEILLERCHFQLSEEGVPIPFSTIDKDKIHADLLKVAEKAMRTLAFAYREIEDSEIQLDQELSIREASWETELIYIGFVGIRDPLRPEVLTAIQECRSAGIEVKMITGDNIETARAIGKDIGLLDIANPVVLTSNEFNQLTNEQVIELLPRLRILARARPLDKYRMVSLLQQMGEVVAVTGDGTNDAPALKKADVGLSMGIAGTEVAKEASKIVLLDDSFATIVRAVLWGRSLYENIQRFIQFQLTINVSALIIAFLGPILGIEPPFTVLQLLWINIIMDTFAAIALCSEPPREGLMKMKPKKRDENIITPRMFKSIASTGLFFVVVMIALLLGMNYLHWFAAGSGQNPDNWKFDPLNIRQVSIFFSVYVFFQVWNQLNCRSLTQDRSAFHGLLANPTLFLIALITVFGQIVMVTFGGSIFMVEPLSVLDWLVIAIGTSSVLLFGELLRRVLPDSSPK